MKLEEKGILRKKRVLEYAEACGNVLKTCRHFKLLYLARCLPVSGQPRQIDTHWGLSSAAQATPNCSYIGSFPDRSPTTVGGSVAAGVPREFIRAQAK